jgi:predicted membrane protein (TIGR00267 family)
MRNKIRRIIKKLNEFNDIAEIEEIARRYFALNSFDGILTALGIVLASFLTDIMDKRIIIISCLGAGIAIAISGFYGAYITEKSERSGKIRKLENRVGFNLKTSPIQEAHNFAILFLAMIEGFSPFLIIMAIISPFFIFPIIITAYYASFIIASIFLFVMGLLLGYISKGNLIASGIKMLLAGLFCAIILITVDRYLAI